MLSKGRKYIEETILARNIYVGLPFHIRSSKIVFDSNFQELAKIPSILLKYLHTF